MNDLQKTRLAELRAKEILTAEEKVELEELEALDKEDK